MGGGADHKKLNHISTIPRRLAALAFSPARFSPVERDRWSGRRRGQGADAPCADDEPRPSVRAPAGCRSPTGHRRRPPVRSSTAEALPPFSRDSQAEQSRSSLQLGIWIGRVGIWSIGLGLFWIVGGLNGLAGGYLGRSANLAVRLARREQGLLLPPAASNLPLFIHGV